MIRPYTANKFTGGVGDMDSFTKIYYLRIEEGKIAINDTEKIVLSLRVKNSMPHELANMFKNI